jgi:NitT/TauT family transport system substrate-binding protein
LSPRLIHDRAEMRRTSFFLLVGVLLLACGGAANNPAPAASQAPVTLKVGLIPIVDVAPIYLGVQQGFFKEQNLTLDLQLAQGGAAIVPAVVSGDYQFGFSNLVSEVLAVSKGLKIQIVSQGVQATDNKDKDSWAILASNASFTSCKSLEGKTIAVNTLKNIGEISIKAACEKEGANVSTYKLIEMNFPDMLPAMQAGRIDAMWTAEPFTTQAKQAGAHVISYNMVATDPHMTVATYFASSDYVSKNKDVVTRFVKAVDKSLDYATAHPDAVRQIVGTYAKIPPAALNEMVLPYWSHDLNKPSIDKVVDLMVKYGIVSSKPDLSHLYA